ncbi:PTS sugar transporter subunit IIA [Bradyrhizobium sp. ISRA443]|uniref:PTS sugar transporter subunit IIA n=1 Tax=unclassified Bradyrhizobium TaxID=2631580 RepID=UPI0024797449|nr:MULTISPECIES: PTS sugar transporter subunit IIA [unclassified Bradyrhizobium]WGR98259.1 PTS sugar transporter subunit IIA [Bradyrhizobium sp. ISRA436]WGS05147.1 PTS sugar transporter subunit IIA [Bradyrhizobium sp. ISRA437]WGS12033.1 PTS sugar transporter subunit IIA [Bradyrhizobium sp. ISRA443]
MTEDDVVLGVGASDKASALAKLASLGEARTGCDAALLRQAFTRREKLGSSGFGGGVAIPHALVDGRAAPATLLVRLKTSIEFDALDGLPVDILYALIWPRDDLLGFLPTLAAACRALRSERLRRHIRAATTPAAVLACFATAAGRRGAPPRTAKEAASASG